MQKIVNSKIIMVYTVYIGCSLSGQNNDVSLWLYSKS